MHQLTLLFALFLIAGTLLRIWLSRRQIQSVRANRDRVPDPFEPRISPDEHRKAADYTVARSHVSVVSDFVDPVLLVLWTLGGGLNLVDSLWRQAGLSPLVTGIATILSVFLLMGVLSLPFSIYRTFVVEERFGFNRITPAIFLTDLMKSILVSFLLGAPLIAMILWIMAVAGDNWWLYAWMSWAAFSLMITWAYPTFIAPIFNKFEPLTDHSLKSRIESLLSRCGFRSNGIFVMDGSRRSSHGNAYFTGLGNQKRIVFFDTLMETLDPAEIEAVLAHELGHFRLRHVRKRLLVGLALTLAGFALLGWSAQQGWFFSALGVDVASDHMAILLFLMVVPVFTFPLTPIGAYLSRRHEFQADEYAANQSDGQALVSALVKLYRDNATTLTPDRIYSGFYDSHPPAPRRIERLQHHAGAEVT